MRLAVVGVGHVGLVTGAALAALGHDVVGTDADRSRVELLSAGRAPFEEPGLEAALAGVIEAGCLRGTSSIEGRRSRRRRRVRVRGPAPGWTRRPQPRRSRARSDRSLVTSATVSGSW